jgi:hypothetical protein
VAPTGYTQYRPTHLQTAGTVAEIATRANDGPQSIRLQITGTNAAITAYGEFDGTADVGNEQVNIHGTHSGATLRSNGASVSLAAKIGQTGTFATVVANNGSFRTGTGATVGTIEASNANLELSSNFTGIRIDRDGTTTVYGAAAAGAGGVTIDGGVVDWRSSGTPGVVTVASGGLFRTSRAPGPIAVTKVVMTDASGLEDPTKRITQPYSIELTRTELSSVNLNIGNHVKITVAPI